MAHFHIKKKKGRPYLYVREIARVGGKPTVVSQVYVGSPERVRELASGKADEEQKLRVEEFGSLFTSLSADSGIDLVGLIDGLIPKGSRETGPSVGEYFLYCVLNRMVEAVSKRSLEKWYEHTAIQQIRPVDLSQLTSERYWDKWDRVTQADLRAIAHRFFEKVCALEKPSADCVLFDTTNYYTYMASDTESELAKRGHSKDGKHQLRQVGLALLVDRGSRLPLYYREYPGNIHDSKQFEEIMDEMFAAANGLNQNKDRITVVMDKGMNSDENIQWIDDHRRVHFVTTYSPYFADELVQVPLDRFEPASTAKNQRFLAAGHPEECLLAYRTKGEFWGKQRTVVVTYNPANARKQTYTLETKLEKIREELLAMRAKVREKVPQWRDATEVRERHVRLCEKFHVPTNLYTLEFTRENGQLTMSFQKDFYRLNRKQATFGKTVIVTDCADWTTTDIVEANLDRWQVEDRFRQSKDDDLVAAQPMRHWTDSKIRCHLFSCLVALTYLRRLELRFKREGLNRTADAAIKDMRQLHSVLSFRAGARNPTRRLETPTKTQTEVLRALGFGVDASGVLQPVKA